MTSGETSGESSERAEGDGLTGRSDRGSRLVAIAAVALVFTAGALTLFHSMLGRDLGHHVPVNIERVAEVASEGHPLGALEATDHRFVVWLVSRNARTLLTNPLGLFQAEQCHPAADALALGEPAITLGVLGMPMQWLAGDPVATYNSVLLLVTLVSFVAMYLLVVEWTGVRTAGLVAALLYAFHELKISDSIHFFAWDNSWTVLALYFATRLFARGQWRDALGLSFAIAMQIGESFYPLLSACFVALPILIWLAVHHGFDRFRPTRWFFVVGVMAGVAYGVLSPFLAASDSGVIEARGYQAFLGYGMLRPSEFAFPGWSVVLLALCSFALPRRFVVPAGRGDPRWALLALALILLCVSTGGNMVARIEAYQRGEPEPWALPNLYAALAAVVPGLKIIRGPGSIYQNAQMAYAVLAGFGAAALIRIAGSRRGPVVANAGTNRVTAGVEAGVASVVVTVVAAGLIFFAYAETLRPRFLGLEPRIDFVAHEIRPPQEEIDFFADLEERGAAGPILELPFNPKNIVQSSNAILIAAYHERRTAQCFNSFLPPEVVPVKALSHELPTLDGLKKLSDLGFTTILLRFDLDASASDSDPASDSTPAPAPVRFEAFARGAGRDILHEVARGRGKVAYDITLPEQGDGDGGGG